jgi:hypothetical protein
MNQFQQAKLKMEALLLLVAKIGVCAQHNLEEASQVFLAEAIGDTRDPGALVGRNLK